MCLFDIITNYKSRGKDNDVNTDNDINCYVIEKKLTGYECIICLDEFNEGGTVSLIKCGHIYHTKCLYTWFITKNTCPVCNEELKI